MTTAVIETEAMKASSADKRNRFFDPKSPEQPDQVIGVDTQAILRLGRSATALGVLPPQVNLGLYTLPDAVRIIPLVEEMQSGAIINPEDVRPYRKPIKKLRMELSLADKLAVTAGAVAVGVPARRALNRKIEREFPKRATEAIDKARDMVVRIENDVEYVAQFENPREQFVTELNDLAQTVTAAITEQRDWRVRNNMPEVKPEPAKGILGFFTKAVRKVREFFGFFKPKPAITTEVTAYDAGAGIEQTFRSLAANPTAANKRLPILSKFVFDKLPKNLPLTKDRLTFVAPEILNFLFSVSPEDKNTASLLSEVNRNPHELRFVTRYKRRYGRYSLDGIQYASHNLLPALRDVLPTNGDKVREIYSAAQQLLQHRQPNIVPEKAPEESEVKKKGLRNRIKNLFRRK